MFLKSLDAEELGPNGSSIVPRRGRSASPPPAPQRQAQRTLKAGSALAREVIGLDKHGLAALSTRSCAGHVTADPPGVPRQERRRAETSLSHP